MGLGGFPTAEEVFFHLLGEEFARLGVREVQAVFVDQASLLGQPLLPGLGGDVVVDTLTDIAGQRRAGQALGPGRA